MTPFLTFYTPTFRRPQKLAACLASVSRQTARAEIEHLVIADHVGVGVEGMFARIPDYASAVHGRYVHVLADDDELASPTIVEQLIHVVEMHVFPPVLLAPVNKGGTEIPGVWPPVTGQIDLGNLIVRADVWKQHVSGYRPVYEGDYWFAQTLFEAGYITVARMSERLLFGGVMRGAPEVAA